MAWRTRFLLLAVAMATVCYNVLKDATSYFDYMVAVTSILVCFMSLHIVCLQPAVSLSLKSILNMYFQHAVFRIVGYFLLRKFISACNNVEHSQTKILNILLRRGETTQYGLDHKLADIRSVKDFRSRMALTTYEDYKPYIEKCLRGEGNIFFKEEVDFFASTSGTTSGKSKLYPVNTSMNARTTAGHYLMSLSSLFTTCPNFKCLQYAQNFWIPGRLQKTDKGIDKGSVSTKLLRVDPANCAPPEVYKIYDERSGYYIQMLFTLREPEISVLMTMSSSLLLILFSLVEIQWKKFVRDIRRGEIDKDLNIPEDIRKSLNKQLTPSPARADELEAIFKSGFEGMVPRIWKKLNGIGCLCTGPFALQAKVVQDLYVGTEIPLYANLHMSTESTYGCILFQDGLRDSRTGKVRDDYVILCNDIFYEFIPAERTDEDQPETVLAHQVEVGRDYELVITTARGFYRYRSGDLVRIAGYQGNTPRYRILQRVGEVLNVHLEKVPEVVLAEAVQEAAASWSTGQLMNFSATENVHIDTFEDKIHDKLYYVIFVATENNKPLQTKEKDAVDTALMSVSDTYRAYRTKGTISPARIIQVRSDSFEDLRTLASDQNPLLYRLQYKHPRIIRNRAKLELLINNVI